MAEELGLERGRVRVGGTTGSPDASTPATTLAS